MRVITSMDEHVTNEEVFTLTGPTQSPLSLMDILTLGPAMAGNSARSIRAYSARAELGRICKVACCIIYAERPSQRMEE